MTSMHNSIVEYMEEELAILSRYKEWEKAKSVLEDYSSGIQELTPKLETVEERKSAWKREMMDSLENETLMGAAHEPIIYID